VFSHGQLDPVATTLRWDADQTAQWLHFLGGTLDLDEVDAVLLDLPPGYGPVHRLVFDKFLLPASHVVHVTSGDASAIAGTRQGLSRRDMHDTAQHWVLENLSRVRVTTADGDQVEGNLYGGSDAARVLAEQTRARYAGSLPWEPDPALLARAPEIGQLAAAVVADRVASGAPS
jgi:Mrp family chromosome partitioning ATPase